MTNKRIIIYRTFSLIAVCAIMITIFILSAQNSTESNETSGAIVNLFSILFDYGFSQEFVRTLAHFCEYAGLGFFMHNAVFSYKNKTHTLASIILSWAYAWTDEIHQIFVPGRAFQFSDLLVDLGGVAMGSIVFAAFIFTIKKIQKAR